VGEQIGNQDTPVAVVRSVALLRLALKEALAGADDADGNRL
jgi:hypothetical protein